MIFLEEIVQSGEGDFSFQLAFERVLNPGLGLGLGLEEEEEGVLFKLVQSYTKRGNSTSWSLSTPYEAFNLLGLGVVVVEEVRFLHPPRVGSL